MLKKCATLGTWGGVSKTGCQYCICTTSLEDQPTFPHISALGWLCNSLESWWMCERMESWDSLWPDQPWQRVRKGGPVVALGMCIIFSTPGPTSINGCFSLLTSASTCSSVHITPCYSIPVFTLQSIYHAGEPQYNTGVDKFSVQQNHLLASRC